MDTSLPPIAIAEFVAPGTELRATIDFLVQRFGFRVETISPADAPRSASLSGHGIRVRLDPDWTAPTRIRLRVSGSSNEVPAPVTAPNGMILDFVLDDPPMVLPPVDPRLVVTRCPVGDDAGVGRAGMRYRDLVPGRHGGRFIASHIAIPDGGPVPDYVHFHQIRFQMIFCRKGWVRVAYEDQGDPLVMHEGDCVLQPPRIRHRVLEASPGLEVVEIASPATHDTYADHQLTLPTGRSLPDRDFGGQRFVHHVSASAPWQPWTTPGFEAQDLNLGPATNALAAVSMIRAIDGERDDIRLDHPHEFAFWFVLDGNVVLDVDGQGPEALAEGDSCTVPAGRGARFTGASDDLRLLEVIVAG